MHRLLWNSPYSMLAALDSNKSEKRDDRRYYTFQLRKIRMLGLQNGAAHDNRYQLDSNRATANRKTKGKLYDPGGRVLEDEKCDAD